MSLEYRKAFGFLVKLYTQPPPPSKMILGPIFHYHLFPKHSVPQEDWTAPIKMGAGLGVKLVPQLDGSRLKVVAPTKADRGSTYTISRILEDLWPTPLSIIAPGEEVEEVFRYLRLDAEEARKRFDMYIYRFHEFGNANRYIPIVFDKQYNFCYNVQSLFSGYAPEDNLGIILSVTDARKALALPGVGEYFSIDYRPRIRLCPTCSYPHDVSVEPPKRKWINAQWEKLQSNHLSKRSK